MRDCSSLSEVLPTFERPHRTHRSLLVEGVGGWIVLNNHPDDAGDLAAKGNRRLHPELTNVPLLFELRPGQTELELAIA